MTSRYGQRHVHSTDAFSCCFSADWSRLSGDMATCETTSSLQDTRNLVGSAGQLEQRLWTLIKVFMHFLLQRVINRRIGKPITSPFMWKLSLVCVVRTCACTSQEIRACSSGFWMATLLEAFGDDGTSAITSSWLCSNATWWCRHGIYHGGSWYCVHRRPQQRSSMC